MSKRPASSLDADPRRSNAVDGSRKRQLLSLGETTDQTEATTATESTASTDKSARISLPTLAPVTPWVAAEISPELPPLPEILDPELEEAAFSHPGLGQGQSYERLEWLGDAYLELIASSLIFQTFGRTPSGRCSQLREQLIRNTTLADYFRQYQMTSRARLPADFSKDRALGRGRSSDKDLLKTQGDMFEAFVAAVILSDPQNGLANTISWLKALWGRTIKDQIQAYEKSQSKTHPWHPGAASLAPEAGGANAKERLRAAVGARGISLRYEDMPGIGKDKNLGLPLYTVGVYLDGWGETNKLLGTGTALKKKEAGQKAAAAALANKRLLKTYEAKKRAMQEAMKAAAEEEVG